MTLAIFVAVVATVLIGGDIVASMSQVLRYRMLEGLSLVEAIQWILKKESVHVVWYDIPLRPVFFLAPLSAAVLTRHGGWNSPFHTIIMATLPVLSVLSLLWLFPESFGTSRRMLLFPSIVELIAAVMGAFTVRRLYVWLER